MKSKVAAIDMTEDKSSSLTDMSSKAKMIKNINESEEDDEQNTV